MITAVDTSVLLDVFSADARFGPRSKDALRRCIDEGGLIACDVVWAETGSFFRSESAAREAMESIGVAFAEMSVEDALAAAAVWKAYRARGGKRTRVIADFLIGAHAAQRANRLLTRDRGFYRSYFTRLEVIDPSRV